MKHLTGQASLRKVSPGSSAPSPERSVTTQSIEAQRTKLHDVPATNLPNLSMDELKSQLDEAVAEAAPVDGGLDEDTFNSKSV